MMPGVTDEDQVRNRDTPRTRTSLAADLRALGVRSGSVLLVHASMKSLGWVCGGTVAVVQALLDVLGDDGTLVVPTHTPENSDPAAWRHPPVPESWWQIIRDETPGFDPAVTPSRWMGVIAEAVRTWPGARRSDHPHTSFAAVGPAAEQVVSGHRLDGMLGESSPLGQIYALDGDVLLLGVDHTSNTSLHLAEYRQPRPPRTRNGAAVLAGAVIRDAVVPNAVVSEAVIRDAVVPGAVVPDARGRGRAWVEWEDVDVDESDFGALGVHLDDSGAVTLGLVGSARCRLMRQRAAVDFAVSWIAYHRDSADREIPA
jgi:aminoglycoside 3-N-acetyltransferase